MFDFSIDAVDRIPMEKFYLRLLDDVKSYFNSDIVVDEKSVHKLTSNYRASYPTTTGSTGIFRCVIYSGSAGENLKDFIDSVINGDENEFIKVDNLVVHNYKKKLFDIENIHVIGDLDDKFFYYVKKYFHNIKNITISESLIKKECSLNNLDIKLEIKDSTIEDIRSFNDMKGELEIWNSKILKISPSAIKVNKFSINNVNVKGDIDFKMLFLKCNFPELLRLEIYPYGYESLEGDLTYLPFSVPNLEDLYVHAKVKDLNFITYFKHLIDFNIAGTEDWHGLLHTCITDGKERNRLLEKYKREYEVQKLLYPESLARYVADNMEHEKLLRLCSFLNTIHCNNDDIEFYKPENYIKFLMNQNNDYDVVNYYESYYDNLKAKKQYYDNQTLFTSNEYYHISMNNLYVYDPYKEFAKRKYIVIGKPFMFASNGNPIIFMHADKPIKTIDDFIARYGKAESVADKDFMKWYIKDSLDELFRYLPDEDINVGALMDEISEEVNYRMTDEEYLNYGETGKKIYDAVKIERRYKKRDHDVHRKMDRYEWLLYKILANNYDKFDIAEKYYIYFHVNKYPTKKEEEYYNILVKDEEKVLESINKKTDGLYSKYYNYKKCFEKLDLCTVRPEEIVISAEEIKKLKMEINR